MENTLENKAKFFAQYICHRLDDSFYHAILRGIVQEGKTNNDWKVKTQHLSISIDEVIMPLKPLSSITDEDSKEIAKIGLPDKFLYESLWSHYTGRQIANSINSGRQTNTFYPHFRFIDVADYLRSKGYALPWMGLSVETLIEYGWIKLATS